MKDFKDDQFDTVLDKGESPRPPKFDNTLMSIQHKFNSTILISIDLDFLIVLIFYGWTWPTSRSEGTCLC